LKADSVNDYCCKKEDWYNVFSQGTEGNSAGLPAYEFPTMKTDVLLLYSWVRSSYAVLNNLHTRKLSVATGDSVPLGMCQLSRLKTHQYRYVSPLVDKDLFIEQLCLILKKTNPVLLLPSHDETELIAANRHQFPDSVQIPVSSIEQIRLANDKSRIQEFAEQCGVSCARRFTYTVADDLLESMGNNAKTVIRLRKGNSAKGVFYATGPQETVSTLSSIITKYNCTPERLPVVQEYVHGDGWGVSCLYWEGKRVAHFTHHRLREKTLTGGTSTLREHKPNEKLEQMAFTLLDKLEWHGLAMVEFKYDSQSGNGYFIEINPRLWGSIHLAISARVEFPYLLYLCATQGPDAARTYQKSCTVKYPWRSRWYLGDCIAAVDRLRSGRVADALRCLLPGGTDTYDDINWKDPGAFLGEILYYAHGFIRSGSTNPVQDGMIG
jgi:predicted ATP-grasp superfamily ATP-dependent carboligase